MSIWKKNPAPQPHHDNTRGEIASLKARIARLEAVSAASAAKLETTLYQLDPQEDVLVQCSIGAGETVSVPLSQIAEQIQQAMLTKLTVKTPRASRVAKLKPAQSEGEQNG